MEFLVEFCSPCLLRARSPNRLIDGIVTQTKWPTVTERIVYTKIKENTSDNMLFSKEENLYVELDVALL